MTSKEETKKLAKTLLAKCKAKNIKLPTDEMNAIVQCGMMLNATKEDGEFQLDAAVEALEKKFGVQVTAKKVKKTPTKSTTAKKKVKKQEEIDEENRDDSTSKKRKKKVADEEEEGTQKKARKRPTANCPENQEISDIFSELAAFEFQREAKFKGMVFSKVGKAIRDHDVPIKSGKEAMKLKGIGKGSAAKLDEYFEKGEIEILEEYRKGNL